MDVSNTVLRKDIMGARLVLELGARLVPGLGASLVQ